MRARNFSLSYNIYTPVTLWEDFDSGQPLDVTVVREQKNEGIYVRELYFSGRQTPAGRPRIFAAVGAPEGAVNPPCLVIAGDVGRGPASDLINFFCSQGFAAICFDYCGERPKGRFTLYPESISYANYARAGRNYGHCDATAKQNCWYEWTGAARYAVSLANELFPNSPVGVLGVRMGGLIAWHLAASDSRVCAAVSLFYAGWERYRGVSHGQPLSAVAMSEEMQRYLAGIAGESYAAHVRVPFLFLSSTNDDCTPMDRAYDTLSRVPAGVPLVYAFSPRFSGLLGDMSSRCMRTFLKSYVAGESVKLPRPPKASLERTADGCTLRVWTDPEHEVEDARIFYSLPSESPMRRDWTKLKLHRAENGGFEALLSPACGVSEIIAFPHITHAGGFTLSGTPIEQYDIDFGASCRTTGKIIYQSAMGEDSFTSFLIDGPQFLPEMFLGESAVTMEEGPLGIKGIATHYGALATYKVGAQPYRAAEDSLLRFDIHSAQPQKLEVYLFDGPGTENRRRYRAEFSLLGGDIWQPITCRSTEFKAEDGIALKSFASLSMIAFRADGRVLLNNMLWV